MLLLHVVNKHEDATDTDVLRDLRPTTIPFANYLVNIQVVIFLVHCELCSVAGN